MTLTNNLQLITDYGEAYLLAAMALSAVAFLTTFFFVKGILATQHAHKHLTFDFLSGAQKVHANPTSRIGGVSIAFGLILASTFQLVFFYETIIPSVPYILVSAFFIFALGLAEDVTKRLTISTRLIALVFIIFLQTNFLNTEIKFVDIQPLDDLLNIPAVSLIFTIFALTGVTNAYNLIDGTHGLSTGIALIAIVGIGFVAMSCADWQLFLFSVVLASACIGFLIVNFPSGKIFLGDGGAYLIGFLVGVLAILLPVRNPTISPWASLLFLVYPVTETIFTVLRRLKLRHGIASPDLLHLHSLLLEVIAAYRATSRGQANGRVAPFLWAFASLPFLFAIAFRHDSTALMISFLFFNFLYLTAYKFLMMKLSRVSIDNSN